MAKGARKKTKWVLLTTTVPPTEKEADTSAKLPWETKPRTTVPPSDDCNQDSEYNVQNQRPTEEPQDQDRGTANSSSFSNGYRTSSSHHYPPSHHRNYSRSHHHYSGSSRKSHYANHHGVSGSNYKSSSSSTAEVRNEQTSSVTINEDEYTKITTPRQDVLFKKGYLSRPKKHLSATTSENGLAVNGSSTTTTTDGSDIATGSGSVSTAESVTSDSTYLTDGLLMDPYPTPYPYFGYIDQSGVLVMNGFAVDSNGYSYMNGGQTYIYPPNYNLSQTFEEEEGSQPGGDEQQTDSTETELSGNGAVQIDASANKGSEQIKADDLEDTMVEEESLNQQITPQQFLAPYADGYDYAQFYNNFYYPGCVMAPVPVVDNGLYYDQFETPSDNHFDFKKYRKWPRNWEEYPVQIQGDTMTEETYRDPTFLCTSQDEEPVTITTEVPVNATQLEPTQAVTSTVPSTSTVLRPSANSHKTSSQPSTPKPQQSKSTEQRSQQQPNHAIVATTTKSKTAQKIRKRDLIESTRAFAEQNIDLSRPTYLQQTMREEPTTWRTVCNGKEVAIEDDRTIETKSKMEAIREVPETSVVIEPVMIKESIPIESKAARKESKRGKKTAKGKGKKQKRQNVAHQQKGFEVIEPEFTAVSRIVASPVVEEEPSDDEQDQEDAIEEAIVAVKEDQTELESSMLNDEDSQTVIEAEADEDLEQMLQGVQLTDIHVEEDSMSVRGDDHVEETESLAVETPETYQEAIDSDPPQVTEILTEEHVVKTTLAKEQPKLVLNEDPAPAVCDNIITPFDNEEISCETCGSPISCSVDVGDKEEEIEDLRHFSGEEDCEHVDSGVQSPAAFISPAAATIEEKKERSYSGSGLHVTDAVTKWLSETLSSTTRLEELFVLPENPELLHRIQQFHVLNFEDSLAFSSDAYSSSGDEADDSDYMSDVQVKKIQKTESQKDQLAKQTANGQPHHQPMIGDHSNCKQKRCIIM